MGPHLHPNRICPYSSSSSSTARSNATITKKTSKYYLSSTVKKVQKKLNKLGYKCGKADGVFGKKTKNVIKKFQKEEGLSVNGNINKTLLRKLKINIWFIANQMHKWHDQPLSVDSLWRTYLIFIKNKLSLDMTKKQLNWPTFHINIPYFLCCKKDISTYKCTKCFWVMEC